MGRRCNDFGFGEWAAFCGPGFAAFGPRVRSGRGRQRFGRRGDLKYVILSLLDDQPMHGYEIIRRLEEESGGIYSPSPGSVYPVLKRLENDDLISGRWKPGRAAATRIYRLTAKGQKALPLIRKRLLGELKTARDTIDRHIDVLKKTKNNKAKNDHET